MQKTAAAILSTLLLGSMATGSAVDARTQQYWVRDGAPLNCINMRQVRSTNVVNDKTINFVVNSRRMFRNELPASCGGLSSNRTFIHNSRNGQLCSVNTITVVGPGSMRGATCGLGRFHPMKPAPEAAIAAAGK